MIIKFIILIDVQNCRKLESFIISNFKRTVKSFEYFRVTCKLNMLIYVGSRKYINLYVLLLFVKSYVPLKMKCAASTVQLNSHLKDLRYVAICVAEGLER